LKSKEHFGPSPLIGVIQIYLFHRWLREQMEDPFLRTRRKAEEMIGAAEQAE